MRIIEWLGSLMFLMPALDFIANPKQALNSTATQANRVTGDYYAVSRLLNIRRQVSPSNTARKYLTKKEK